MVFVVVQAVCGVGFSVLIVQRRNVDGLSVVFDDIEGVECVFDRIGQIAQVVVELGNHIRRPVLSPRHRLVFIKR